MKIKKSWTSTTTLATASSMRLLEIRRCNPAIHSMFAAGAIGFVTQRVGRSFVQIWPNPRITMGLSDEELENVEVRELESGDSFTLEM